MMLFGFVLLLLAVIRSEARYSCRQYIPGHITCQQRNPVCQILDDHKIDSNERHEILEAHNNIRREAAKGSLARYGLPAAANMKKLEWDNDLANNAQAHVEVTCQLKHDRPSQRTTGLYPDVGQNVYITEVWNQKLQEDSWATVVETLWGKEEAAKLRANSFGNRLKLKGHDLHTIGHLTQLLWADTEKVGCGKIIFENRGGTSDLRTCDYGEGGNVIGGELFLEGPACSACPATHPYCDDGLCSRTPTSSIVYPSDGYQQSYISKNNFHQNAYDYAQNDYQNSVHNSYNWWDAFKQDITPHSQQTNYFQQGTQAPSASYPDYYHNTYNYQTYTVLRRKRRSAIKLPVKRTRVL